MTSKERVRMAFEHRVENQRKLLGPDFDEAAAALTLPAGFLGTPRDIGRLAIFLASDESRYIIGQTICCDGGQTTLLAATGNCRRHSGRSAGVPCRNTVRG